LNECDLFRSLTETIFVNIARRRPLEVNNSTAAQRESNKAQTNGLAYFNSEITHSGNLIQILIQREASLPTNLRIWQIIEHIMNGTGKRDSA
jgi:hypothetical protein